MELGKEDDNCRRIIKKKNKIKKIQVVYTEKLKNYIVLQTKFKHIYCKYLHGE